MCVKVESSVPPSQWPTIIEFTVRLGAQACPLGSSWQGHAWHASPPPLAITQPKGTVKWSE